MQAALALGDLHARNRSTGGDRRHDGEFRPAVGHSRRHPDLQTQEPGLFTSYHRTSECLGGVQRNDATPSSIRWIRGEPVPGLTQGGSPWASKRASLPAEGMARHRPRGSSTWGSCRLELLGRAPRKDSPSRFPQRLAGLPAVGFPLQSLTRNSSND